MSNAIATPRLDLSVAEETELRLVSSGREQPMKWKRDQITMRRKRGTINNVFWDDQIIPTLLSSAPESDRKWDSSDLFACYLSIYLSLVSLFFVLLCRFECLSIRTSGFDVLWNSIVSFGSCWKKRNILLSLLWRCLKRKERRNYLLVLPRIANS